MVDEVLGTKAVARIISFLQILKNASCRLCVLLAQLADSGVLLLHPPPLLGLFPKTYIFTSASQATATSYSYAQAYPVRIGTDSSFA